MIQITPRNAAAADTISVQEIYGKDIVGCATRAHYASTNAIANTAFKSSNSLNPAEITPPNHMLHRTVENVLEESRETLLNPEAPLPPQTDRLFKSGESDGEKRNFLLQVNQLVGEILQLLSRLSDKDRKKSDFMKKEYDDFTKKAAQRTRDNGYSGFYLGLASFAVAFFSKKQNDIFMNISRQLPSFGEPWRAGIQADITVLSNKISLLNTELQNMATKGSDNSSWKSELLQSLNDLKEWLRSSVRSNGG